ncbi:MAG: DUF975 family protein [Eubacterium sp.]|nr:DUF975 family protein [Candidatus Colimonas fimequi]
MLLQDVHSFLGVIAVAVGVTVKDGSTLILVLIGAAIIIVCAVLTAYFWYSFIMVPFIVIMDKHVPVKTAFKMSMAMMKGNRKHAVGLDLSFIGWYLLSAITFGLSDLFYTVAYRELTRAELFRVLRTKAIEDQIDGFEYLVDDMLDSNPDGLDHYPAKSRYDEARIVNYVRSMEPNRHYTLINLILCFFIFSCIGWCWEVAIHIVRDGVFVNRGVNWGPWLPIYGAGGVMIIIFLRRFSKLPGVLMALTFVLCGVVEYFTSWFLEVTKGMKWWDYSDHFMNLNGRICLEGLLTFALAGLLFVYIAGPGLDNWLNKFDNRVKIPVAICLCAIFGADLVYSHFYPNTGKGITAGMVPGTEDEFISG